MNGFPILTIITLLPLVTGIVVAGLRRQERLARQVALGSSLLSLGLALGLWKVFNAASGELQFVEKHEWIATLGVNYFVGVDGLGLLLVMLTAVVTPMAMLASWHWGETNSTLYLSKMSEEVRDGVEPVPPSQAAVKHA